MQCKQRAISYVSDCYGGRASDRFIVENSDFLSNLRPGDQVMADHSFKINDALAFYQCTSAIPPLKHQNLQMSPKDHECENLRKRQSNK